MARKKTSSSSKYHQEEFSDLLVRPTPKDFSEGFLSNPDGTFVGVGRPEEIPWGTHNLDTEVQHAIAEQNTQDYIQCLMFGAEDQYPFVDEEREIIRQTVRNMRHRETQLRIQERLAQERAEKINNYNSFLNEVQLTPFDWKNLPQLRGLVQKYFHPNKSLQGSRQVRTYLNSRILEGNRETGRSVRTWHLKNEPHLENYRNFLRLSGDINPSTDTSRMSEALEQSFPRRFGSQGKQPIGQYVTEKIKHIYRDILKRAISYSSRHFI